MKVAIIGMGFMGGVHLKAWQAQPDIDVVAVCDANPISTKAKPGNLGGEPETLNLDGVNIYSDISTMLKSESLDAASITLPTHLHKSVSIQLLEAGIHVLCEKPMGLNIADCDAMIEAANQNNKQLMIAQCIRFWPEYRWAKQQIDCGTWGRVLSADFSRLTYSPVWDATSWFSDPSKSGGIALDLHIHDLDYIQYLFGIPEQITAHATPLPNGVPGHILSLLNYKDALTISATASWALPESFGFQMSFRIIMERAVLLLDSQSDTPLRLIPANGETRIPALDLPDAYRAEIEHFIEQIKSPTIPHEITPQQARESVRLALESLNS